MAGLIRKHTYNYLITNKAQPEVRGARTHQMLFSWVSAAPRDGVMASLENNM